MHRGQFLSGALPYLAIAFAAEDGAGGGAGAGDGAGDGGAGEGENTFASSLTGEGYGDFVKEQGWQSPDDAVKAYQEQRAGLEGMIKVPGADASDEDKAAFAKAVGVPDSAEGYEFKVPEKMPENVHYDEGMATAFKGMAKDIGLTPTQAQAIHDFQMEQVGNQANAMGEAQTEAQKQAEAAQTEKANAAHADLEKQWGAEGGESYNKNLALANRALANLVPDGALEAELKDKGVFGPDGQVLMPVFAQALASVGQKLYAEDGAGDGETGAEDNPWADETFNLTKQGDIFKTDPEKAARLKAAAKGKGKKK